MATSGNGRTVRDRERAWAGPLIAAVVTAVAAALFLPHQALWIDETTQLSGLTLSPAEVIRWLIHPSTHDFGVPGDRMPFLSYWVGWLWSRPFGVNETSLRWLSVVLTAGAAALVASAGTRAFGRISGLFAGLFFGLSANVCVTAVEIRAYPLFLLTTAGALRAWVIILRTPEGAPGRQPQRPWQPWLVLTGWLLAGLYTHFFGALFAGVLVLGLAADRLMSRRPLRPVLALGGVLAVAAVGLAPFVLASVGLSGETARDRGHEIAALLYRLLGNPATSVHPVVTALLFLSAATLVVTTARLPSARRRVVGLLLLVLGAGLAISIAANFVLHGFTAAKVSYSSWALPVLSLVLAAPLAHAGARLAMAALAASLVFLACEGAGIAELARHGDHFAHGPHRRLQHVLDRLPPARTAVVHVDSDDAYGAVYFPLRFSYGPGLTQLVATAPGTSAPLGVMLDATEAGANRQLAGFSTLVFVRSRTETAHELAGQLKHGDEALGDGALLSRLEASPDWKVRSHDLFVAFVTADVTVLERAPAR
jgi:hypothetical protein